MLFLYGKVSVSILNVFTCLMGCGSKSFYYSFLLICSMNIQGWDAMIAIGFNAAIR